MITTLLSDSRWHPCVLQLLPFSENDALSVPRDSMSSQTHLACPNKNMRDNPVLAVTMATKCRTKSVFSPNSNALPSTVSLDSIPNQGSMQRILDVSSDKFTRRHSEHTDSRDGLTSKKDAHPKDTQVSGTFRIALTDVSVKTKNRIHDDSHSMTSTESRGSTVNLCKDMVKSLPKPIFKPIEWRLFHRSDKYSKNSIRPIVDVEGGLDRQKRELSQADNSYQHTGRIKLNVKELQRSKTPISENDPDKLNMKHVIAFLQSTNKVMNGVGYERPIKQTPLKLQSQLPKRLSFNSSFNTGENGACFDQKQQVIKPNRTSDNFASSPISLHAKEIIQQHPNSRLTSYNNDSNKAVIQDSEYDKARRQSSHGGENRDQYSDDFMVNQNWNTPAISDLRQHLDQRQGPKSLGIEQHAPEVSYGRMPPITCKQKTIKTDKSFRLHRLVSQLPDVSDSLVSQLPDVSDSLTSLSHKVLKGHDVGLQNDCDDVLNKIPRLEQAEKNSKSLDKLYHESPQFSWPYSVLPQNKIDCRPERRPILKSMHIFNPDIVPTQRTTKVICLPTAHIEGESDEDSSALFTVANAENKKEQTFAKTGCNFKNMDKTTDKTLTSYSCKETHIEEPAEETNTTALNKTCAETNNIYYDQNSKDKQIGKGSTDFPDNSMLDNGHESSSPAFIKEDQTRKEAIPNSFQLNTHQKTFIRLLNQELAAMKRTVTWQEQHQHLFSPLVCEDKMHSSAKTSTDPKEQVKLSLRKERNKTRVHTYMTDLEERCSEL